MPTLFRRQEVWLPTTWSFLAIVLSVLLVLVVVLGQIHTFLSPNAPMGHGLLLVEGWLGKAELRSAIEIFQRGNYELLLATGGPVSDWDDTYPTYADRACSPPRRFCSSPRSSGIHAGPPTDCSGELYRSGGKSLITALPIKHRRPGCTGGWQETPQKTL